MIKRNSHNGFEESPSNTSATSPLVHSKGETGALRSSVFEINKSSSIVNFITHVWSCCSDLLFAVWSFGPEGRQLVFAENRFLASLSVLTSYITTVFLTVFIKLVLETKHVSVIDVDRSLEVRC